MHSRSNPPTIEPLRSTYSSPNPQPDASSARSSLHLCAPRASSPTAEALVPVQVQNRHGQPNEGPCGRCCGQPRRATLPGMEQAPRIPPSTSLMRVDHRTTSLGPGGCRARLQPPHRAKEGDASPWTPMHPSEALSNWRLRQEALAVFPGWATT